MKRIITTILVIAATAGYLSAAPALITSVQMIAPQVRSEIVTTAPAFIAEVSSRTTADALLTLHLASEIARSTTADAAVGVSTAALRVDVNALIASTGAFITTELDPVFKAHVSSTITSGNIASWNSALHTETDPIFSAHISSTITSGMMASWGTPTSLSYPFQTVNSSFSAGVLSSNGYPTIFWKAPSGKLVLGCNAVNGECGSSNVDSEGIAVNKPSVNGVGRLKADGIYIAQSQDTSRKQFSATNDELYFQNYRGSSAPAYKLFDVVAASSVTTVSGGFKYVDGNQAAGKILVSDASGNATWTTPTAIPDSIYTIAEMESLPASQAGLRITVSDASAPYSECKSTGTAAGSWVLLNQSLHCQ